MHPVLAKLSAKRRGELSANPLFALLSATRKNQLLDTVVKVRASLDYEDRFAAVYDQDARMADVAKLKGALNTALTIFGLHRQITADMIGGLTDSRYPESYSGIADLEAFRMISRRMLAVAERLVAEPQERMSRKVREARLLALAFAGAGLRVKMTRPPAPNPSLDLLGLLADPPATPEAMLGRLRR